MLANVSIYCGFLHFLGLNITINNGIDNLSPTPKKKKNPTFKVGFQSLQEMNK